MEKFMYQPDLTSSSEGKAYSTKKCNVYLPRVILIIQTGIINMKPPNVTSQNIYMIINTETSTCNVLKHLHVNGLSIILFYLNKIILNSSKSPVNI